MRRLLVLAASAAVGLLLAVAVLYVFAPRATPVKAGAAAPDFTLAHHDHPDARLSLHELRGSPVVLTRFDSSWPTAGPDLNEMEKVHRRFLRDGLVVVGVALDDAAEARALEFLLKNRSVSFTVLVDPGGRVTGPLYGMPPDRKPETYVIDATGRVVSVHLKAEQWSSEALLNHLAALLVTPHPR